MTDKATPTARGPKPPPPPPKTPKTLVGMLLVSRYDMPTDRRTPRKENFSG